MTKNWMIFAYYKRAGFVGRVMSIVPGPSLQEVLTKFYEENPNCLVYDVEELGER